MNKIKVYSCTALLTGALLLPSAGNAQGINLADAFKPILEQMAKQMAEISARSLVLSPAEKEITVADSSVVISVTNPHKDSATAFIKFHNQPPPSVIPGKQQQGAVTVDESGSGGDKKAARPKRSLVAEDEPGKANSVYQDLTPWVTSDTDKFVLAPGETKQITVSIKPPVDMADGEYAAWFATHLVIRHKDPVKADNKNDTASVQSSDGKNVKVEVIGNSMTVIDGTEVISNMKIVLKK